MTLAAADREQFIYHEGYTAGRKFALDQAFEAWEKWNDGDPETATAVDSSDAVRSPAGPSPVGAPPTGSTDARPASSPAQRISESGKGEIVDLDQVHPAIENRDDIVVVGHHSRYGTMLASPTQPGPDWVRLSDVDPYADAALTAIENEVYGGRYNTVADVDFDDECNECAEEKAEVVDDAALINGGYVAGLLRAALEARNVNDHDLASHLTTLAHDSDAADWTQ